MNCEPKVSRAATRPARTALIRTCQLHLLWEKGSVNLRKLEPCQSNGCNRCNSFYSGQSSGQEEEAVVLSSPTHLLIAHRL